METQNSTAYRVWRYMHGTPEIKKLHHCKFKESLGHIVLGQTGLWRKTLPHNIITNHNKHSKQNHTSTLENRIWVNGSPKQVSDIHINIKHRYPHEDTLKSYDIQPPPRWKEMWLTCECTHRLSCIPSTCVCTHTQGYRWTSETVP